MEPNQLSPVGKTLLSRIEFDANEKILLEVKKHPVGLFLIYLAGMLSTLAVFGIMVLGAAAYDFTSVGTDTGIGGSSLQALIIGVGFFLTVFTVAITAVVAFIYTHNVLIVTSEKIAQQIYITLFNKKISQLSIADVQDSTVRQDGIIAHIFNYGTITIETAGEQSNYTFTFAPNPYEVSKALTGAHEADVAQHGN